MMKLPENMDMSTQLQLQLQQCYNNYEMEGTYANEY